MSKLTSEVFEDICADLFLSELDGDDPTYVYDVEIDD